MDKETMLITGAGGMLGKEAALYFRPFYDVVACTKAELDITDDENIRRVFRKIRPGIVLNCSVLRNEKCESNRYTAYAVNALGCYNLAKACWKSGAVFVLPSTDYVFSGESGKMYRESALPSARNLYGETKWLGEQLAVHNCPHTYICRTAWLYGRYGINFVNKILDLADDGKPLHVVQDQVGCPTSTIECLKMIHAVIHTGRFGIYHTVCTGSASRYEFALEIKRLAKFDCPIYPADNPNHSCNTSLSNQKIRDVTAYVPIDWREALKIYMGEIKNKNYFQ